MSNCIERIMQDAENRQRSRSNMTVQSDLAALVREDIRPELACSYQQKPGAVLASVMQHCSLRYGADSDILGDLFLLRRGKILPDRKKNPEIPYLKSSFWKNRNKAESIYFIIYALFEQFNKKSFSDGSASLMPVIKHSHLGSVSESQLT